MNITTSTIYWITRLDNFRNICEGLLVFSIISTIAIPLISCAIYDIKGLINRSKVIKSLFFSIFTLIISVAGLIFIPSTKEICAMTVIPKIVNNEKVQDIGNEVLDNAVEWLKVMKPKNFLDKNQ